jgi:hypothetical protein
MMRSPVAVVSVERASDGGGSPGSNGGKRAGGSGS